MDIHGGTPTNTDGDARTDQSTPLTARSWSYLPRGFVSGGGLGQRRDRPWATKTYFTKLTHTRAPINHHQTKFHQ